MVTINQACTYSCFNVPTINVYILPHFNESFPCSCFHVLEQNIFKKILGRVSNIWFIYKNPADSKNWSSFSRFWPAQDEQDKGTSEAVTSKSGIENGSWTRVFTQTFASDNKITNNDDENLCAFSKLDVIISSKGKRSEVGKSNP